MSSHSQSIKTGALVWLGLALAAPANAQTVAGEANALDGDSLVVAGKRMRLFGIDAPEFDQTCTKDGSPWPCGQSAKEQLSALVAGQWVKCQGQGVDQHGRILATCSTGSTELNQVMVEQGWAIAYRDFSNAYISAELSAKTQRLGIWSSSFAAPADYRLSKLPPAERAEAPPQNSPQAMRASPTWSGGCVIKGNRNRRGEWIYHLPGMPYYDQTRPEEIFCTEAEAQAAGYRRAIVKR